MRLFSFLFSATAFSITYAAIIPMGQPATGQPIVRSEIHARVLPPLLGLHYVYC